MMRGGLDQMIWLFFFRGKFTVYYSKHKGDNAYGGLKRECDRNMEA